MEKNLFVKSLTNISQGGGVTGNFIHPWGRVKKIINLTWGGKNRKILYKEQLPKQCSYQLCLIIPLLFVQGQVQPAGQGVDKEVCNVIHCKRHLSYTSISNQ